MTLRSFLLAFFLLISGFALAADPTGTNTTGGGNSTTEGNSVSNCTQGSSQNGFPAGTNTCSGTTPVVYTAGPGDVVSSATAWYGLRAYTAAIAAAGTQKLINIRNIATSETCDVIVATNGGFGNVANCSASSSGDTVAVFCAESSSSCTITKFYDQSGNSSDMPQATTNNQPALSLSCLNSLPCAVFNGSSDFLATASALSLSTTVTISAIAERTASFTSAMSVMGETSQSNIAGFSSSANTALLCANCSFVTAAATDSVWHAMQYISVNSSAAFINVDGVAGTSGSPGTGSWGSVALAIGKGNGNLLKGNMTEAGIWASNFTSGNNTAMCRNQQAYYGASNFGAAC